jgi:lysozyme family protein
MAFCCCGNRNVHWLDVMDSQYRRKETKMKKPKRIQQYKYSVEEIQAMREAIKQIYARTHGYFVAVGGATTNPYYWEPSEIDERVIELQLQTHMKNGTTELALIRAAAKADKKLEHRLKELNLQAGLHSD